MYVFQIPFEQQKEMSFIFDPNSEWEKLAALMGYKTDEIYAFRKISQSNDSPTMELLRAWGSRGYAVDHLIKLCAKLKNQRAVKILLPFVDEKLQSLILSASSGKNNNNTNTHSTYLTTSGSGPSSSRKSSQAKESIESKDPERGQRQISKDDKPMQSPPIGKLPNQNGSQQAAARGQQPSAPCKNCSASKSNENRANAASGGSGVDSSIFVGLNNTLSINYDDLAAATGNFSAENVIGRGGYGVVYKGTWKHITVAVKRLGAVAGSPADLKQYDRDCFRQSLSELKTLAVCRHDNILPLYAYSLEGPEPCVVYQFMAGGSLDDRILCRQGYGPLTWSERVKIARGSACGLNYLHTCARGPLIHGDIKSANILLDSQLQPKIGDFGLCRPGIMEIAGQSPKGSPLIASHIKGTLAYLPPEFLRNKHLSTKLDVYSFGVVFFELATGFRAHSEIRKPNNLVDFMKEKKSLLDESSSSLLTFADKKVNNKEEPVNETAFLSLIEIGFCATAFDPLKRPTVAEIVEFLDTVKWNG